MRKLAKKKTGGPIKDSTAIYKKEMSDAYTSAAKNMTNPKQRDSAFARAEKAGKDMDRQAKKGKPGYTSMGFPIKKQMGGSAKPTPSKPIDFKEAKAKAKYNPNIIEEKERALKNSPEYKIQNYKPYKPMVAKNGGSVKSKTKK